MTRTNLCLSMWVMVCCVLALSGGVVWADDDPNGPQGYSTVFSGETSAGSSCFQEVYNRDGYDGGQLTIELDTCQIISYTIIKMAQNDGAGATADLEKDDLIIVWDEDPTHGEDWNQRNFTYTGTYVADPNCSYIKLSTTDSRTNWAIYRVTASGTFTKGSAGTNEHELVKTFRNYIDFSKDDGIEEPNCVLPEEEIHYSICWDNNSIYDFNDCFIVDWLPLGVTYPGGSWTLDPNLNLIPPDPSYDPNTHSYVYLDLGTIAVDDANCVTLDVVVNGKAEPGLYLHNVADLYSVIDGNDVLIARATEDTLVCCWDDIDPNIIYVDWTAEGDNNGTDWDNAYTDLADALRRAADSNCVPGPNTIYVAQGIYDPNETTELTFALPDGCSVYGGFKSGGCNFSNRNPKKYETILTGLIDEETLAMSVVTMGDETLLDGFTITESSADGQAIYASGVDCSIAHCDISQNDGYGAYLENSNVEFRFCRIRDNDWDGIYHSGSDYTLYLENVWCQRNRRYGLACYNSTPTIRNSNITESDLVTEGRAGIFMANPTGTPYIQNCTVAHNKTFGIWSTNKIPIIQNSIVFHNGGSALVGFSADDAAHYSCIEDCNSVNNNINTDPDFVYFDPNNVRISTDSSCKDSGNPSLSYDDQVDMDSRERLLGTYVDRGAYEVIPDCASDSHAHDINHDGVINLVEYGRLSAAWLSHDPNDPEWLADPNLADPNLTEGWYEWKHIWNLDPNGTSQYVIDLADLDAFVSDLPWLWKACWYDDYQAMYGMSGGGESMMTMSLESFSIESTTQTTVIETEPNYADMPESELALFVKAIYEIVDYIDWSIEENHENAENLIEAKDFLEDVLSDIKASRQ